MDYNRSVILRIEIVSEPGKDALAKRGAEVLKQTAGNARIPWRFYGEEKRGQYGSMQTSRSGAAHAWRLKNITSYKGVEKALTFEVTL